MAANPASSSVTQPPDWNVFSQLKNFFQQASEHELYTNLVNEFLPVSEFNVKYSESYDLSLLHVNIHSLNSKVVQFRNFVNSFTNSFDVIALSEVWSNNLEFYHNILSDYNLVYDLPSDTNVGGFAFFVRKNVCFSVCTEYSLKSCVDCKVENVWIKLTKNRDEYIIGGMYRHPAGSVDEFTKQLDFILSNIPSKYTVILTGDININLINYESHAQTKNYTDMLISSSYLPVLLLPTRITDTSSTLIDHIFIKESKNKVSNPPMCIGGNIMEDLSDHVPNYILLKNAKFNDSYAERPLIRVFNEKNCKKFASKLSQINWDSSVFNSKAVNECYERFTSVLSEIYNDAFPLVRQSRRAHKNKPWFTPGLRKSRDKNLVLYKRWLNSRNESDFKNYKSYNKQYRQLLTCAANAYYSNRFDTKTNSIKKVWANLKTFLTNKKPTQRIESLSVNGQTVSSPSEISNELNKHFCKIGSSIASKLPAGSGTFNTYLDRPNPNSMFVTPVTELEVVKLLNTVSTNKASGDDGFSNKIIKENKYILSKPLTEIFNMSLNVGIVPECLKIAKVIPIHKKGDLCNPNNYRPISLLSIFNKILEKLVQKRLDDFLEKYEILNHYQYGFRKKHSTTLAVTNTLDDCYQSIDNNNVVLGLFLDLEKAFDTVDHKILLAKLDNYGIRGKMNDWIKDYLSNRQQYTVVGGVKSTLLEVQTGVPQGSVLGPLFFVIYINDIANTLNNETPRLFADDTNLFIAAPDIGTLRTKANDAISALENWFLVNRLSLNTSKTNYIIFKPPKFKSLLNPADFQLSMYGQQLTQVSSTKYLGMHIDDDLSWKTHIDHLHSKLRKMCAIFYRIRSFLPFQAARMLYFALVHSQLVYGIENYANTFSSYLDKLHKINNKILRILFNKPFLTPTVQLYAICDTLPIALLHEYRLLTLVQKCVHHTSTLPHVYRNYFCGITCNSCYSMRNYNNLKTVRFNSTFCQRSFKYKGTKLWNELPNEYKVCQSVAAFTKMMKNRLKTNML